MKNIILILLLILSLGCELKKENQIIESKRINIIQEEKIFKIKDTIKSNSEIVKEFAESFKPNKESNKGVERLNNIPLNVIQSFNELRTSHKSDYEKYLTLIFVKLYSSHLQCCHQSYEIRNSIQTIDTVQDALVYEFGKMTNFFTSDKRIEFLSSGMVENWVNQNPRFLTYELINKEMDTIKKMNENIKKDIYWD